MKVRITKHGKERMEQREITVQALQEAMAKGKRCKDQNGNLKVIQQIGNHSQLFLIIDNKANPEQGKLVSCWYRGLLDNGAK